MTATSALPREEQHVRVGEGVDAAAGMVFSDEPGITFAGEFGVRLRTTCTSRRTARAVHTAESVDRRAFGT